MASSKSSSAAKEEMLTQKQRAQRRQAQIHTERSSISSEEHARQRRPVGAVAIVVSVCLILGGILALNAYRIQLNYQILKAENELTEAQSVYVTMQNQLDALASEQGRDAASFGMQEAKLSQMHYIDLTNENKIELVGEMSVWDKIAAFFGGLFD